MESQDLDRHKRTEDDEPDVEAHRHHSRHKLTEDNESTEPDVEAHRHHSRHKLTDDNDSSDEPDVEAHRFMSRTDDSGFDPDANRMGGRG
ncbi:MAG: hypothetical protein QOG02_373 [Gaiellales bacterium]|nr:hypothetical protein [Gaiellales bacterium]MDX6544599.1 hypothetical protein [Gaiellales bacterium]